MFKLPSTLPTLQSKFEDLADYAEYIALINSEISFSNLLRPALIASDEIEINGIEDDSDKMSYKIDEISSEINRRINVTNGKYPFSLINKDYSIKCEISENDYFHIYTFMLLATRLNMLKEKVQDGIDGTHLFEKLSALVALNFFGENTQGDVFGTSKTDIKGFRAKLHQITTQMKEGGPIHERPGLTPQDDKVDIIVWKGFSDQKKSQLIAFGQCKTGTNWKEHLSELDPDTFCKTWFTDQPIVLPVKMFFCAQYFHHDIWDGKGYTAGLIFDRFRIIDYLPSEIDQALLDDIKKWNVAAKAKHSTT